MKIKIGIITELVDDSLNYGNILQAFALNNYLNSIDNIFAETLIVNHIVYKKNTSYSPIIIANKVRRLLKNKLNKNKCETYNFYDRMELFNKFSLKIKKKYVNSIEEIINAGYDCLIVGSDIVWIQDNGVINRLKFLDFDVKKKISYAASFGNNFIPKENIKHIKRYLKDFEAISLRENNSVEMLNKIGIKNVEHVCDPTMLLDKIKWQKNEKKPSVKIPEKYIFVYLLGKSKKIRNFIKSIAKKEGLFIVSIPHANGCYSDVDNNFADISISDCSPENWLYLINHSEYVFTDSFHGAVFSSIFEKKFLIFSRENKININNRMLDLLDIIDEKDKYISENSNIVLLSMNWNYKTINKNLNELIEASKEFLKKNIM